jgi:hypothetical protein
MLNIYQQIQAGLRMKEEVEKIGRKKGNKERGSVKRIKLNEFPRISRLS